MTPQLQQKQIPEKVDEIRLPSERIYNLDWDDILKLRWTRVLYSESDCTAKFQKAIVDNRTVDGTS